MNNEKNKGKCRCKYNKNHIIDKEEYDKHLLECPDRNEEVEDLQDNERLKVLDNIATEKEQIAYVRNKYYKNCVEEPEIPGLGKKKQKNKKKKNKYFKEKFSKLEEKEKSQSNAIYEADKINDDNIHNIADFQGDDDFNLDDEDKKEDKKEVKKAVKKEGKKEDKKEEQKEDKKEDKKEGEIKKKKLIYDPNEED